MENPYQISSKYIDGKDNHIDQKLDIPSLYDCRMLMKKELYREAKTGLVNLLHSFQLQEVDRKTLQPALILYADAQRQTGHFEEAYNNYCTLIEGEPALKALLLRPIFHCLTYITRIRADPTFESYLILFIAADYMDTVLISPLVKQKLRQDLHIGDENYQIELQNIASNTLLLAALPKLLLSDPELELFLNQLRFYLLSSLLDQGRVDLTLTVAMALRAYNNGYLNYVTTIESELARGLFQVIETFCQESENLDEIEAELIVLAMYLSLDEFPTAICELNNWPVSCSELVQAMIKFPAEEIGKYKSLRSISPVSNPVSQSVQKQYESHSYPLWQSTHIRPEVIPYFDAYPYLSKLVEGRSNFEGELSCLVAGCGTGKHPITLAKNIANLEVIALDLSKASLAYASRLADTYQVKNLDFVQGDILDLGKMGKRFDIIECIGVLHHMEDPHLGLSALLDVLAPGGILNLGLYSAVARREINQVREANLKVGMALTIDNIREFRFELLNQSKSAILESEDFYATASCHDLLFHEQEYQFSIIALVEMLEKNKLQFLGFHSLDTKCLDRYRKIFPDDVLLTNLNNWHQFESKYPDTFAQMYQFHCRKIS